MHPLCAFSRSQVLFLLNVQFLAVIYVCSAHVPLLCIYCVLVFMHICLCSLQNTFCSMLVDNLFFFPRGRYYNLTHQISFSIFLSTCDFGCGEKLSPSPTIFRLLVKKPFARLNQRFHPMISCLPTLDAFSILLFWFL